ncbi:MAG: hypothetical protein ABIP46_02510, partial [Polaromonas sp.]
MGLPIYPMACKGTCKSITTLSQPQGKPAYAIKTIAEGARFTGAPGTFDAFYSGFIFARLATSFQ